MNLLLVDDQPEMIAEMLEMFGKCDVDIACDGYQAIQKLLNADKNYEIIILDIEMPVMSGWQVLGMIRKQNRYERAHVAILSSHHDETLIVKALREGADEFWMKPISPRRFLAHMEALCRRIELREEAAPQHSSTTPLAHLLTSREKEILYYVVQGLSNQRIAEKLTISETTVKNHLANIYRKLKVRNRNQAAFFAQNIQLIGR